MADHKLHVLLVINIWIMLCASLRLSNKQPGETGNLFNKLFPGEERSIREDWSKDERSMFAPKFPSNRETKLSAKEQLFRDILDWNKRRLLDQGKQSQDASEKREPQRCWSGHMNGCQGDMSTEELENKISKMTLSDRETAPGQMDEMDIEKLKEYDMELERALRELEVEMPGAFHNQM